MTLQTDADGVPIFGAGTDHERTRPFAIEIYDSVTGTTENIYFEARVDIGAGPFVAFTRAARAGGDALTMGSLNLLVRVTVDSDGLPSSYEQDQAEREATARAAWDETDHDPGEEWAGLDADPRLADIEQWSSKRRFIHYADSDRYHMAFGVIVELAQWIVRKDVSERPTRGTTPTPAGASSKVSSPGQTRKRAGSAGSRSKSA